MALTTLGHDGRRDVLSTAANATTSGEDIVLADVSGGTVTITLATADQYEGNVIWVKDINSNSSTNTITVNTGGTATIDGSSSQTITTDGRAVAFIANGTNWFSVSEYEPAISGSGGVTVEDDGTVVVDGATAINASTGLSVSDDGDGTVTVTASGGSGGTSIQTRVEGAESGEVAKGDQGVLVVDSLADTETLEIRKASLTTKDVQAVATGVNLEIVTFDEAGSYTSQSVVKSGDGTTVFAGDTGSPIASYKNTTGAGQTVGVLVDNGSGSSSVVAAKAAGAIV